MPIKDTFTVPLRDPAVFTLATSGGWYAIETTADRVNIVNKSAGDMAYRVTYPDSDATTEVYTIAAGAERLLDLDEPMHGYPRVFHLRGSVVDASVGVTPAVRP